MWKLIITLIYLMVVTSNAENIAHTEFSSNYYQEELKEAYIGIKLSPEKGWHSYWSNPGEAGMAPYVSLEVESLKIELMELSIPKRFEMSGIVGYGYEKPVVYIFKVTGDLPDKVQGTFHWLACDDVTCLPGKAKFSFLAKKELKKPDWLERGLVYSDLKYVIEEKDSFLKHEDGTGVSFSFSSDKEMEGWSVFPHDNNFSEVDGEVKLRLEGERYHFSFDYTGELPRSNKFLITDGEGRYILELSE